MGEESGAMGSSGVVPKMVETLVSDYNWVVEGLGSGGPGCWTGWDNSWSSWVQGVNVNFCWQRERSEVDGWEREAGFLWSGDGQAEGSLVSSLLCLLGLVNLSIKDWRAELTVSVTAFLVEDSRLWWRASRWDLMSWTLLEVVWVVVAKAWVEFSSPVIRESIRFTSLKCLAWRRVSCCRSAVVWTRRFFDIF